VVSPPEEADQTARAARRFLIGLSVASSVPLVAVAPPSDPICAAAVQVILSTSMLSRLLAIDHAHGRSAACITLALFAGGAALATCWDVPLAGPNVFVESPAQVGRELGVAAAVTALAALCIIAHRFARFRAVACVLLIGVHLAWLAAAVAFAVLLAWTVPIGVWIVAGLLLVVSLATAIARRQRIYLPIAVPLGFLIAALLSGWGREDGAVRCDDYLRTRASGAAVLVPTAPDLERCQAGERLLVARYPRRIWEYPDGERFLLTTQRGLLNYARSGDRIIDWFSGAVCQVGVGAEQRPVCFFDGKAQAIVESPLRDRVYVAGHDEREGAVFALPRSGPVRRLAEARVPASIGGAMYVDDEHDVVGAFEDRGRELYLLRASDLAPLGTVPAPVLPDASHYDQARHQGIVCAGFGPVRRIDGQAYAAVAFDGVPFACRPLAPSSHYPSSWLALTWGCDWDPTARRAYAAVASLGLIEEIDYDTGDILRRFPVGLGVRSVAFDARRRRLYAAFFLSGDVIAIDLDSGATVVRWFAGRFVRQVTMSRDERSLLVTSNLGIVRIPLPETGTAASSASAVLPPAF
jgi:hypothetical protein